MRLSSPNQISLKRGAIQKTTAFTLVELLVVIGIIALLISILLPSLNKARRAANTIKCSSNMRQVALAMLQYVSDSKGKLPPMFIREGTSTIYPDGFGWANQLWKLKYISAPNVYDSAGNVTFSTDSPFRCPEGVDPSVRYSGNPQYPTDPRNSIYNLDAAPKPRVDGEPPYGIATWYMLNGRTTAATAAIGSGEDTPFLWFNGSSPAAEDQLIRDAKYQRNISMIKRSSSVIMILEAANHNWTDQTQTVPGCYVARIGARHGKMTADGHNAYTNLAFFDGHVDSFPTKPISMPPANINKNALKNLGSELIVYLTQQ